MNSVTTYLYEARGRRFTMEDTHIVEEDALGDGSTALFAIFDGHGGSEVSMYLEEHFVTIFRESFEKVKDDDNAYQEALRIAFKESDIALQKHKPWRGGSTGVVALLVNNTDWYIANCGDSEAVIYRHGGCESEALSSTRCITKKHTPQDMEETNRIIDAGGCVLFGRVDGCLAVTRSFGDFEYVSRYGSRKGVVIADPYIAHHPASEDDVLILACDGLWDVFSYEAAVRFCDDILLRNDTSVNVAECLVESAINERKSTDNVSVIVIQKSQKAPPLFKIIPGSSDIAGI